MALDRQPSQRPIPVERAVRWLPLDDPFYMLATVLVTARAEPLFVSRDVLVAVETHLREGSEDDALGVLYGGNFFCTKTRIAYLLVEGVERAPVPSREHDRDAVMAAELRALAHRVEASGKLVIGWYHGGADLTPRIGLREIALHLAVCTEPWQVALLRAGVAPDGPRRGALARVEPTERRVYPIPFVELLPHASRDPDSRRSAVAWTSYRSEAPVAVLPDSAFVPPAVSGPIEGRSRLSLLGALHGLIGGSPPPAPEPADRDDAGAPEQIPTRPSARARPFTPPETAKPEPARAAEREVPLGGGQGVPADAAPPAATPPPLTHAPRPADDAPVELSGATAVGGVSPPLPAPPPALRREIPEEEPPVGEPDADSAAAAESAVHPHEAERQTVDETREKEAAAAGSAAPEPVAPDQAVVLDEPAAGDERAVEIRPLPRVDAAPPENAARSGDAECGDESGAAPPDARTATPHDWMYPAALASPAKVGDVPVDIARIFEAAPATAEDSELDFELEAEEPQSPLPDYLRALQRPGTRARLVAGVVAALILAGAAALFARQRTRGDAAKPAPEAPPSSTDSPRAARRSGAPAAADSSDTVAAAHAMQDYARTRLAAETSALSSDVASLGAALQVVLGPSPRSSTDSLRRSLACTRADSARTDAILHEQAVQLAQRYLKAPGDLPAVSRATALASRADTLSAALRSPCPPAP